MKKPLAPLASSFIIPQPNITGYDPAHETRPSLALPPTPGVCLSLRVRELVYAKARRASVEHCRVMHALSQVDSGRECARHSQSTELGNFMLLGAYSTHPGAMRCEVGGR
ncbi:unnamed protein product [Pleuronectes platessa]|uniref:Uncharacterized protein n=1 Tax=Pleuronectes platessa TaxID=8262 RepID=A0A9N7Y6Y6_PLEPL|nr:unnamed protein product [Pleuronectes platessa]